MSGGPRFSISRTAPPCSEETWLEADLGDLDVLPSVVKALAGQVDGRLDGVVLNAALADKSRSQWHIDQVERHLRINTLAPFLLWSCLEEEDLAATRATWCSWAASCRAATSASRPTR